MLQVREGRHTVNVHTLPATGVNADGYRLPWPAPDDLGRPVGRDRRDDLGRGQHVQATPAQLAAMSGSKSGAVRPSRGRPAETARPCTHWLLAMREQGSGRAPFRLLSILHPRTQKEATARVDLAERVRAVIDTISAVMGSYTGSAGLEQAMRVERTDSSSA